MKTKFLSLAFAVAAMITFNSCEKAGEEGGSDNTQTNPKEELLEKIDANFDKIIATEWAYKEFQPSDDMLAASSTEDGYVALSTINAANAAKPLQPILTFTETEGVVTPFVKYAYDEADKADLLSAYEIAIGIDLGFYLGPDETHLAQICRTVAAGFAADNLGIDDITSEETGALIFTFSQSDLSAAEYDDIVLSKDILVKDCSNKIYINEDGTLTVETSSEAYGISKTIFTAVEE